MRIISLVSCFLLTIGTSHIFAQQYIKKDSVEVQSTAQNGDFDVLLEELMTEYRDAGSQKRDLRCSFLMLNNLAMAAESIEESQAFDCLNSMLGYIESLPEFRNKVFERSTEDTQHVTATPTMALHQKNRVFDTEIAFLSSL